MKNNKLKVLKNFFILVLIMSTTSNTFGNVFRLRLVLTNQLKTTLREVKLIKEEPEDKVFIISSSQIGKTGGPKIKFKDTINNLGELSSNRITTYVVKFKNEGDEYLIIKKVDASCGCVQIDSFTSEPLSQGEYGQIKISINPALTHDIVIKKYIYITSNVGMHKIKFIGKIIRN